jgi:hypothetical protein
VTLAETQTIKPDGHGGMLSNMRDSFANMRGSANEALQKFARQPKVTLPMGKKKIEVATDRVRAVPAITPTLSGMIGMTAVGLGLAGLLFPKAVARSVGLNAPAPVVQLLFGAREMWSGVSLVSDPTRADVLWARVAGDVFDIAALRALDNPRNNRRGGARGALAFVLGVTALDVITAVRMSTVQRNCE